MISFFSNFVKIIEKINMRLRRDADERTEFEDNDEYELENEDSDRPERVQRDVSNHARDLQNDVKELGYDIK